MSFSVPNLVRFTDFAENGDSPDVQEEEEETVAPEEVPEKSKTARNIRAPSRYDDCMLDISHVPESLPEEVGQCNMRNLF